MEREQSGQTAQMGQAGFLKRFTDKLFGGMNMSWPAVIIYAVASAVLTAFILIVPIFKGTSITRIGSTFEAWIFFAVVIMANCKKPLESALKVFVFFLISQPLIYLFQVPFSWMGWKLFGYYRTWFIWTLLTFPMAFIGWYINKKNWLSALILLPVLGSLATDSFGAFLDVAKSFPHNLVLAVFCLLQVVLYIYTFFPDLKAKIIGALFVAAIAVIVNMSAPAIDLSVYDSLPDEPVLTSEAVITVEDTSVAEAEIVDPENARVHIDAHGFGTTNMTVTDGGTVYSYTVEVYDDDGISRIQITPAN